MHHIEGHIAANYIEHQELEPPFLCLVVSGGHTHLVQVHSYTEFEVIGCTHDDAAGEAFDKVARAIGLGYPEDRRLTNLPRKEIRRQLISHVLKWMDRHLTLVFPA